MSFSPTRLGLLFLKLFLMLVVSAMILFQIPELRYDFGTKSPVQIESAEEMSVERFNRSTFAAVRGKPDFSTAATFAKYGVNYTYFLLEGYGAKVVVRTPESVSEEWNSIDRHVGRLRPFERMPFSRRVRAGFRQHFDLGIPENALFLARDDVPRPNGWSVGAVVFASVLWLGMFYFFFVRGRGGSGRIEKAA